MNSSKNKEPPTETMTESVNNRISFFQKLSGIDVKEDVTGHSTNVTFSLPKPPPAVPQKPSVNHVLKKQTKAYSERENGEEKVMGNANSEEREEEDYDGWDSDEFESDSDSDSEEAELKADKRKSRILSQNLEGIPELVCNRW